MDRYHELTEHHKGLTLSYQEDDGTRKQGTIIGFAFVCGMSKPRGYRVEWDDGSPASTWDPRRSPCSIR